MRLFDIWEDQDSEYERAASFLSMWVNANPDHPDTMFITETLGIGETRQDRLNRVAKEKKQKEWSRLYGRDPGIQRIDVTRFGDTETKYLYYPENIGKGPPYGENL